MPGNCSRKACLRWKLVTIVSPVGAPQGAQLRGVAADRMARRIDANNDEKITEKEIDEFEEKIKSGEIDPFGGRGRCRRR